MMFCFILESSSKGNTEKIIFWSQSNKIDIFFEENIKLMKKIEEN